MLGLASGASAEEIRAARRKLARAHHPDNFSGETTGARKATQEMALINEAAEELLAESRTAHGPKSKALPTQIRRSPVKNALSLKWYRLSFFACSFILVVIWAGLNQTALEPIAPSGDKSWFSFLPWNTQSFQAAEFALTNLFVISIAFLAPPLLRKPALGSKAAVILLLIALAVGLVPLNSYSPAPLVGYIQSISHSIPILLQDAPGTLLWFAIKNLLALLLLAAAVIFLLKNIPRPLLLVAMFSMLLPFAPLLLIPRVRKWALELKDDVWSAWRQKVHAEQVSNRNQPDDHDVSDDDQWEADDDSEDSEETWNEEEDDE